MSRALSVEAYAVKAKIVLHAPLQRMREAIPPSVGRLQRIDDASCMLEVGAHRHDAIAYHIALLGVEFEVLEPTELVDQVRAMANRFASAAARPG